MQLNAPAATGSRCNLMGNPIWLGSLDPLNTDRIIHKLIHESEPTGLTYLTELPPNWRPHLFPPYLIQLVCRPQGYKRR